MFESDLQRYTEFFERLNAENLRDLVSVMTADVHFVDPFNDVHGIEPTEKVFRHMYQNLHNPQFKVTHAAMTSDAEPRGLIRWELNALLKGKPYKIVGMSEIAFAADGRVCSHIDHWDAARQFYEHLPVIGWLLRKIRARLAV